MRPAQNQQPRQVWKDFRERMSDSLLQGHEMFAPLSPCRQTEDSIHIIRLLIRSIIKQGLSRVLRGLKAKAGKRRKTKKAYFLSMP